MSELFKKFVRRNFASYFALLLLCAILTAYCGCKSPEDYRKQADKVAENIIKEAQEQTLGSSPGIDIERPSDIFRRRLLSEQNLPYTSPASLGTDKLPRIEHWPEKDYPAESNASPLEPLSMLDGESVHKLSLLDALQIGARNNFDYQNTKENIFLAALRLDLERNEFRNIFNGEVQSLISTDMGGDKTVSGTTTSGQVGLDRKLKNGTQISTALAVDLAKLLTLDKASSMGMAGDASISIPLLRGSGEYIVTEPLTQAERDVVYSIYNFERFKQTFAVSIANQYLGVMRQLEPDSELGGKLSRTCGVRTPRQKAC